MIHSDVCPLFGKKSYQLCEYEMNLSVFDRINIHWSNHFEFPYSNESQKRDVLIHAYNYV